MNDSEMKSILDPLRLAVKEKGDILRSLKEAGAADQDIKKAVFEYKAKMKILVDKEAELVPKELSFDRIKLEDLLKQRFFYIQSFEIYGGVSGQYDFGPMGCSIKYNLLNAWKNHFVSEEDMLEVDCTTLTPEPILKASGHVDRFADYMIKDLKNGECFRLDHLIKGHLEKLSEKATFELKELYTDTIVKLDGMSKDEMNALVLKYGIKSPITGNDLSEPIDFNLMFDTQIGPTGQIKGFLRPETAQGIFVNFKRLLGFNQGKLPFAVAQIGNAFRNEISPRCSLLRVREFTMAEIEHFVDEKEKDHPKFSDVAELELMLYPADNQQDGKPAEKWKMGDAIAKKVINNETLGYFMARIYLFLVKVGVDASKIRFRQHMQNEMAHYACDCWDAECKTSYGWVECVGCADRSCYDLSQHSKSTGVKLVAEKKLNEPKTIEVFECQPQKSMIGKVFKKEAKDILAALASQSEDELIDLEQQMKGRGHCDLLVGSQTISLKAEMLSFRRQPKTIHVEEIIPGVIEPSFGIGRIMYAIFEHNFKRREGDEQRNYLSLPAIIAPYKCSILPLNNKPEFKPFIEQIRKELIKAGITRKTDDSSGSIGRRYARTDEIAIPYGITIDLDTLKIEPPTVTLRERDTMEQIRVPITEIANLVRNLINEDISWTEAQEKYPKFEKQESN